MRTHNSGGNEGNAPDEDNNLNINEKVWHQAQKLLQEGINVIPVRDKDDGYGAAKSPYKAWQKYQTEKINKAELFSQLERNNTSAIAVVCGKVSGNFEAIDIDSKHKPGIDALIFSDIKEFYPEIWIKLLIHQSISKGYHLPYRLEGIVGGSQKIAGRPTTQEEIDLWIVAHPNSNAKNAPKATYFVETRGEGALVIYPPSLGYSVVKDCPLPTLSLSERESILNICKKYHEIIKIEQPYKPTKYDDQWYDENPFEDFNKRCDPIALIEKYGWTFYKKHGNYLTYARPGGKKKDVHASFDLTKRFFYIFTTNSELESGRAYQPATVLALLEFGGNKKRTYAWLVDNGYGKVKPKIEQQQVKKKAHRGETLPANFSEQARGEYKETAEAISEKYPYGVFWNIDEDDKVLIDREGLYKVATGMGYKLYNDELVQVQQHSIYRRSERNFYDTVKGYIKEDDAQLYRDICNAYEVFIQKNGKFTISRMQILTDDNIISDTREASYKFFTNCYIKITAEAITPNSYDSINGLIWHESIQQRSCKIGKPRGIYLDFIQKAIADVTAVQKVIGYLSHQYKDETVGYIIVLSEVVSDPKKGGGSGKNIFCKLFQHTTTYYNIPGSQVQFNEKFLQSWNYQRIMAISDAPKKFDFVFLKELASGEGVKKNLFKDEIIVSVKQMPKFIIQTNYSFEIVDGGVKRRIIPIEFTNFFTLKGGVDVHYGKHFPSGWTDEDWAGYDAYIFDCIQKWLASDRKLEATELTESGWIKQFDQEFGQLTREFIEENWNQWTREPEVFVPGDSFANDYQRFCTENTIAHNFRLSSQKMNKALDRWSEKKNVVFLHNESGRNSVGTVCKGRKFIKGAPF